MEELAYTSEERLALNTVCTYSLANTGLAPEIKQELLAVLNAFNHHCMEKTNELISDVLNKLDENRYSLLSTALTIIMG